jgi:hypothetical protein
VRVRLDSIEQAESAEVSAEIRDGLSSAIDEGHWQLREIRTAPDRWEQLEVIARAAKLSCRRESVMRRRSLRAVSQTRADDEARALSGAQLFGVALPRTT